VKETLYATVILFSLSGIAAADDVLPPSWRGQPRTVQAKWNTFNAHPGMPADVVLAPGLVNPSAYLDGTGTVRYENYQGRTRVVEVEPNDTFSFSLSNFVGGPGKLVWVQVTYYGDANIVPRVEVTSPGPAGPALLNFENTVGPAPTVVAWRTDAFSFGIQPNPSSEEFSLHFLSRQQDGTFLPATVALDQVNIDTICPEPAFMSVLTLAVATFLRRRAS
jgi:hypothetical protein